MKKYVYLIVILFYANLIIGQSISTMTHEESVNGVAFIPSTTQVITSSSDGSIGIWNLGGDIVKEINSETGEAFLGMAYSEKLDAILVGTSEGKAILWQTNGTKLLTLEGHDDYVKSVAISPKGKFFVTGSDDETAIIWGEDGSKIATLEGHSDFVNTVAISPDGKLIATGAEDKFIKIWDTEGKELRTLFGHSGAVIDVTFSPDSKFLLSGGDGNTAKIWNLETGQTIKTLVGHDDYVNAVAYSPDGTEILTGSNDNTVKMWNLEGKLQHSFEEHTGPIHDVIFTNNGQQIITASDDHSAKFWDATIRGYELVEGDDVKQDLGIEISEGGENYYALIIGVDDYADEGIPDLDKPVEDAKRLKEALIANYTFEPNNVEFIENPTRADIVNAFAGFKKLTDDDNLLVFYAGHGNYDADLNMGYWLPSDAQKNSPANWLENSTIQTYLKGIKARHILLITDACFSGSIFSTRAIENEASRTIRETYKKPSRKAMTSSGVEVVPDQSVFLDILVKTLERNEEKYTTASDLFYDFREVITNNSQTEPLYSVIQDTGDELGEFIFIKR